MSGNLLQAVLDRAAKAKPETEEAPKPRERVIRAKAPANQAKAAPKPGRASTKLIGGHFAPEVSTQLRIIAAEEGTTIQNLLAQALDDLFVKKGKSRITGV
jgi:hypothetical protein